MPKIPFWAKEVKKLSSFFSHPELENLRLKKILGFLKILKFYTDSLKIRGLYHMTSRGSGQ